MVQTRNINRIAIVTGMILLVPLVAMQFTDGVVWSLSDFVLMGALLLGTGLTYELIASRTGDIAYRAAVGIAVAAGLLLVWINLAVGMIGSEDNPANVMYLGVLAVAILGAVIARLQARGMARALFATAFAQLLVGVTALTAGWDAALPLDGIFAALWCGSALLFRRADEDANQNR